MIKKIKYNLERRTSEFGKDVILFCRKLPKDNIVNPLVSQLVRSATSIGANYMEANGASSKKDFRNKIYICKKESQESKHWLHMISVACPDNKEEARLLWKECQELTLIFGKIVSSLKNSNN
jgi:four helix bundle protein